MTVFSPLLGVNLVLQLLTFSLAVLAEEQLLLAAVTVAQRRQEAEVTA